MNADFYTFTKRENSTKRPTGTAQTYDITLKDEVGLVRPSIVLNIGATVNPTSYNYCYIADFSRYYFIENWRWYRGLWTADLSVDVLATYKTEIGEASEYVARSASSYNGDIVDNLYPLTGEIEIDNTALTTIWNHAEDDPYVKGFYVVGVIGSENVTYWLMGPASFRDFMKILYSESYANSITTTVTQSNQQILTAVNPLQYIDSIRWYPFTFPASEYPSVAETMIPVGWGVVDMRATVTDQTTGQSYTGSGAAARLNSPFIEVEKSATLPAHPQAATRGRYMNKGQFTSRSLFYPPFGVIGLDSDKIAYADSIKLVFRIDFRAGTCYMTVYSVKSGSEKAVLAYVSAQGCSDCMRAGITNNEWSTYEEVQKGLEFGAATAHRAAGVVNTFDITKPASAAGTVLEGAAAAAETAADAMSLQGERSKAAYPVLSTKGQDGAVAAFMGDPCVTSVFQIAVDDDLDQRGRPLCEKVTLNTLFGYIVVSDPDIALASTSTENAAVKSYMARGFFYE